MRSTIFALSAALVLAAPAAPAASAPSDFRLPPDPSTTQPPPDRQGPVAPDVPESRRPAPTPTPTVTANRPAPAPTITVPPIEMPPAAGASPAPTPARRTAAPPTTSAPTSAPPAAAQTAAPEPGPAENLDLPPAPESQGAPAAAPPAGDGGSAWLWPLALVALAAAGFAGWIWRRRRHGLDPSTVPMIERPRLPRAPAPQPAPASPKTPPAAVEPLQVTLEPLRLSLTLLNATLSYRLEIANHGPTPLTGLAIGADMISAHASMSREEQLAGPHKAAAPLQRIERLEPGESRVVEGEFRVPFSQIVPIRQGNAALLLPLARFRVETEGARPIVRTFVVGQPGQGAGLQPFRLDQGPRVYPRLAQRAFA